MELLHRLTAPGSHFVEANSTSDGRHVLFVHSGRLWRVAAGGGKPGKVADFPLRVMENFLR